MKWFAYNVLFTISYVLMMPKFIVRMRKRGGYKANFAQRLGRFSPETEKKLAEKPRIWIHAVSVGEANLAGAVLSELRQRAPRESFIVSTTSSTGRAVCDALAGPDDVVIYLPVDFPHIIRRALKTINAKALVLTESEFWPNLIRALKHHHVPIILVNGRISDRSAPRYRKLRGFFSEVFACFSVLLVQSEIDRDRLLAAGAPESRIKVMGSVKFDVPPLAETARAIAEQTLTDAGIDTNTHLILLGGSTWPGEERALAETWRKAHRTMPHLRLVLVPRHMERGDEIEAELADAGFTCLRRSRMKAGTEHLKPTKDTILMVDTTGELFALYATADIVFVGKTLSPNVGGQNMIEPAAFGKAVLCGPHTENFTTVMACFRADQAILEVADIPALESAITTLLGDVTARNALGMRAKAIVDRERGALTRSAQLMLAEIP